MIRKSSVDINSSGLLDILPMPVYLLTENENNKEISLFDSTAYIFSEKKDFNDFETITQKYEKHKTIKTTLAEAMYMVLEQKLDGISLHGFFNEKSDFVGEFISREDLERKRSAIETVYYILSCHNGRETSNSTIHHIAKQYFYYFLDDENNPVAIKQVISGKKRVLVPLFLTESAAFNTREEIKTDACLHIETDTLYNILCQTDEDIEGFEVNIQEGLNGSFIDRDSINAEFCRYCSDWSPTAIKSYLKYLLNKGKVFTVLNPDLPPTDKPVPASLGASDDESDILIFERKEDAEKLANALLDYGFYSFDLVGILENNVLTKSFFQYLRSNGFTGIMLNANTEHELEIPIEEAYEALYDAEMEDISITDEIEFNPIKNDKEVNDTPNTLQTVEDIMDDITSDKKDSALISLVYNSDAEMLMYAINYVSTKLKTIDKNSDNQKDMEELKMWKNIHAIICTMFLLRLKEKRDIFIACDENGDPIINNKSLNIILSANHISPNDFPTKLTTNCLKKMKDIATSITFTDGAEMSTVIPIDFMCRCLETHEEEIETSMQEMLVYFYYNTYLSIIDAKRLTDTLSVCKELFDEVIYAINHNQYSKTLTTFDGKTVRDFAKNDKYPANAYIDFVEYICTPITPKC